MSMGDISHSAAATGNAITRAFARSSLVAVTLYVVAVGGLLVTVGLSVASILQQQHALAQTSDLLDQLQGRKARNPALSTSVGRPGAPFLEGATVTVAGAALLQRVATAVGDVGGTIQSSLVDVLGAQAREGLVGIVISCEMDQSALQGLLYDLEAGMPFLFIDQLDVQVPQTTAINDGEAVRIRVLLGVSGQWQGNNMMNGDR